VTRTGEVTTAFFDLLGSWGHEPSLEKVDGTLRFDFTNGKKTERWLVAIRKGDISVSQRNVAADSVIRMSKALFERMASGETSIFPALLRGEVVLEGDYRLLIVLRRLLRRRLSTGEPRGTAGYARRQR
jgi:SCP-2 sterol transfer family